MDIDSGSVLPLIPNQGGPVLPSPKLVTITFAGFPYQQQVQDFGDLLVVSNWLKTVGADYGVGAGTHTVVTLPDAAPTTAADMEVRALIRSHLVDGSLPGGLQGSASGYVYMIYYPPSTSLDSSTCGSDSTGNYLQRAWHNGVNDGTARFAYVVLGTCAGQSISHLTIQASHEFIEAATDPYPNTSPAFRLSQSSPWTALFGGENGDLCEVGERISTVEGAFTFQRNWSNREAVAGRAPCIPAASDETFIAVVGAPDVVHTVSATKGSLEVVVQGWASGPSAPWQVDAVSVTSQGQGSFVLTGPTSFMIGAGEKHTLTVTIPANTAHGAAGGIFLVSSIAADGGTPVGVSGWPVVVTVE